MRSFLKIGLLIGLLAVGSPAQAAPFLQLDMEGGFYDDATETILAPDGPFTLYAILSPQGNPTQEQIDALLGETYYVSVAISPAVSSPTDLGSFTFGSLGTVDVTADMEYGTPPLETILGGADGDPGDLATHSVFPTYFTQLAFQFSALNTTGVYDTAENPGGPIAGTGAFFAAFTGDSSLLADGYQLHFDLYSSSICTRDQGVCNGVGDIDVSQFAPFSHDAGTTRVPEPTSLSMLGVGLLGLFVAGGVRRKSN